MNEIKDKIIEIVSKYVNIEFSDEKNLLGITAVRNVIYILEELENTFNIKIDDDFIRDVKKFSINNLTAVIGNY